MGEIELSDEENARNLTPEALAASDRRAMETAKAAVRMTLTQTWPVELIGGTVTIAGLQEHLYKSELSLQRRLKRGKPKTKIEASCIRFNKIYVETLRAELAKVLN